MMLASEVYELIEKIGATGGATDDMLTDLKRLKDEFDEREGELSRYRESADSNPPDGFDSWSSAYDARGLQLDEMRNRYVRRFISGEEQEEEPPKEENADNVTIDNIFKKE